MLKDFSAEEFDIIIQGGQSNAEGSGYGDVENPYLANEQTYYLNGDFTISIAEERVNGNCIMSDFSLTFASSYIKNGLLSPGRKLLIIRSAVGGTGFITGRWKEKDDLFLRMMDMIDTAVKLNKKNRLVAFLWHQGENEVTSTPDAKLHFNHLYNLVSIVKGQFNCENLPFIAGDFVEEWNTLCFENSSVISNAIKHVCQKVGGAFVETDGLKSNNQVHGNQDTIHFSREALYELGERYFKAFCEITSCK